MAEPAPRKRTSKITIVIGLVVGAVAIFVAVKTQDNRNSTTTNLASAPKDADAFMSFARSINVSPQVVLDAKPNTSSPDQSLVTVVNQWHSQPYQMRLQMAQNLWQSWANVHSSKDLDKARISLRDLNGKEGGGSRVLAGSLVWVQEN